MRMFVIEVHCAATFLTSSFTSIANNFCTTVIKTAYCLKLNEFWVFCPYPSHKTKY